MTEVIDEGYVRQAKMVLSMSAKFRITFMNCAMFPELKEFIPFSFNKPQDREVRFKALGWLAEDIKAKEMVLVLDTLMREASIVEVDDLEKRGRFKAEAPVEGHAITKHILLFLKFHFNPLKAVAGATLEYTREDPNVVFGAYRPNFNLHDQSAIMDYIEWGVKTRKAGLGPVEKSG